MGSSVVLQTFRGLEARSVDGDSDRKCDSEHQFEHSVFPN
jgi:hypothetical protein